MGWYGTSSDVGPKSNRRCNVTMMRWKNVVCMIDLTADVRGDRGGVVKRSVLELDGGVIRGCV